MGDFPQKEKMKNEKKIEIKTPEIFGWGCQGLFLHNLYRCVSNSRLSLVTPSPRFLSWQTNQKVDSSDD